MKGRFSGGLRVSLRSMALLLSAVLMSATAAWAQYVPASNLNPGSATINLDSSFQDDAWLVYTYDIDATGTVVNAAIRRSNGVPELEQAVLRQVSALRFDPATSGGKPIKSSANPVVYTWILDKKREMGPEFERLYRQAWDHYAVEDYPAANNIAAQLQNFPGRNALEEVKYRLLAASLASRGGDHVAELRHLSRVVDFQSLALDNNFRNSYLPVDQYLKVLNRILTLQLEQNMLADAGATLDRMQTLGRGEPLVESAAAQYVKSDQAMIATDDVVVEGELVALYDGGPAAWKTGLWRRKFFVSDVRGKVRGVYLDCANGDKALAYPSRDPWVIPTGWSGCKIDFSGDDGTQLRLHQVGLRQGVSR